MSFARREAGVAFIMITLAIDALGVGIVVPIVPDLVREMTGRPAQGASLITGALVSTFALFQLLISPLLGGLSDRYGRRPVMLLSITGVALNYLLLAWAPTLVWLFVGRAMAGATSANISTANAYLADISTPEQRARRFGLVMAVFSAGFVIGPVLGGVLGDVWVRLPFVVSAGLAGCNALFGLLTLPESLPRDRRRPFQLRGANPVAALRMLAASPFTRRLAVAWAALFLALGTLQTAFVLSNELRFGWTGSRNGLALGLFGVTGAVVQGLLVRRVIARLGERTTAIVGLGTSAFAYGLLAVATSGWVVFATIVLNGFGAVGNPAIRALLSVRAGPTRQGEMMGALSAVEGLTSICAPWIASALFQSGAAVGFAGAPFVAVSVGFLAAVVAVRGLRSTLVVAPA